jgi:hypothetical protein
LRAAVRSRQNGRRAINLPKRTACRLRQATTRAVADSGSCRHNEADVVPLVRRSDRARRPRRQEHRDQAHARRHASVSLRQSKAAHGRKQCAHCKKNVTRAAARFGSDESVIGRPTIRRQRSMQSRWSKFATWRKSISATRSGRRCWSRRRRLLARADGLAPSDANRSVALP